MNKDTSEILAIATIDELKCFAGFENWWDVLYENDRLRIYQDVATALRNAYETNNDG